MNSQKKELYPRNLKSWPMERLFISSIKSIFIVLTFILSHLQLDANPFRLNFPQKIDLNSEDYLNIQQQLRSINIQHLLEGLYVDNAGHTTFNDFYGRCSKGLSQVMIDPGQNFFPEVHFKKIGKGGDSCVVTYASFNHVYPSLVPAIATELEQVGFDGYFLYRIGGFPNPTGKEIQYAGVPYSFKIFMMLEAFQKGFSKVIWIDAAVLPLNNPAPLFDWLESTGSLIRGFSSPDGIWRFIFPKTHELLKATTGTDVLRSSYISATVFGLKMNTIQAQNLIADYTILVEMGYPFLSCFPEEFVLTALLNRSEYRNWQSASFPILAGACYDPSRENIAIEQSRRAGYYFYHRPH